MGKATFVLHGQVAAHGRLAFFPVGILIKTPIAFLLLAGVGLAAIVRLGARGAAATTVVPALAPLLILICCLPSGINIGMRHVLPMFPLLAVVAGLGFSKLWRSSPGLPYLGPVLCVTLLSWLGISSLRAHSRLHCVLQRVLRETPGALADGQ
jgi:hypothetical protein